MPLDLCTITGSAYIPEGGASAAADDAYVWVYRASKSGTNLAVVPFQAKPSGGSFTIVVPRNCTIYVSGNIEGLWKDSDGNYYSESNPKALTVPNSSSTTLESLVAVASIPSEGITIKEDGDAFANLFGTLNFSDAFDLTESPSGQLNIDIAGAGILSLNALAGAAQTLVVGTGGSDFNISSLGTTHTFNIPTASALNRGLLSSANWTTFNNKQAALGFTPENLANKDQNSGYAGLDSSGKINPSQLPAIAISSFLGSVASQAAMLALTGQEGDWAIRTDTGTTWFLVGADPTQLSSWQQLATPTDTVSSVFGRTGVVTAQNNDYTWAQINKAVSSLADLATRAEADLTFTDITTNNATSLKHGFLPKLSGNASDVLKGDGSWGAGGGGGTPGGSSGDIQYNDGGSFAGALLKQGSNLIEQRNGTNAQKLRVYNTYTASDNYNNILIDAGSNYGAIMMAGAGGSAFSGSVFYIANSVGSLQFQTNGNGRWNMNTAGHLLGNDDNSYDIGAAGATRPRAGYFGTSLRAPEYQDTNGVKVLGTQGAAVADATGAGDVVAQLNFLLARCRAHGLIAT